MMDRERKWPDDIQPDAELPGIAFTPVPSALNDRFALDLRDSNGMKQSAHFLRLNRRYVAGAQAFDQHLDRVRVILIGRLKPQHRGTFVVHALVRNPACDFCEIGLIVRFADGAKLLQPGIARGALLGEIHLGDRDQDFRARL
jgi:hypothetical protein